MRKLLTRLAIVAFALRLPLLIGGMGLAEFTLHLPRRALRHTELARRTVATSSTPTCSINIRAADGATLKPSSNPTTPTAAP